MRDGSVLPYLSDIGRSPAPPQGAGVVLLIRFCAFLLRVEFQRPDGSTERLGALGFDGRFAYVTGEELRVSGE